MEKVDLQKLFQSLVDRSRNAPTFIEDGKRGYIFSDREFGMTPKVPLADELKARFDIVVDMNANHTAEKGTSMATFELCGCIGGYIDNPNTNTFFHYNPFGVPVIDSLVKQHVSGSTNQVHFFVPGRWQKGVDGKYERQPKERYNEMLGSTVARIRSMGVECVFHCYDEMRRAGDDYMARNQGTVWIDKQGKLSAEGMPIQTSNMRPVSTSQALQPSERDPN